MVLEYLENRVAKEVEVEILSAPDWASSKNSSLKAWQFVEKQKNEKAKYIKNHFKSSDFVTQKTFQIKGADVANALNISRASLMNTSQYSIHFKEYLDSVNEKLMSSKDAKLRKIKKKPSRGSIRSNKNELVRANTKLKKRVAELETQNIEDLVKRTFDQLPLPIKRKLGID